MNVNQIINMVVRVVVRRVINSGVNAGIDAVGKRSNRGNADSAQAQGSETADVQKRAKQAMRIARRLR